jgi:HlyD family secretion protein
MNADVDLSQLAVVREPESSQLRPQTHALTRYVLPGALLCGFALLILWSARDMIRRPQEVTVMPVTVSQSLMRQEGTPLFKAAGWVEPRPTSIRVAALAPGVVEHLLVVEDQAMKKDEPIAQLVKEDADLAARRFAAVLEVRKAELAQAKAKHAAAITRFEQPDHLEAILAESDAALAKVVTQLANLPFQQRRSEADLEYARDDLKRKQEAGNAVAPTTLSEARARMLSAIAMVEELKNRKSVLQLERDALQKKRDEHKSLLESKPNELQERDEAAALVAAAAARVDQASATLDEARLRQRRMTIVAPVAGRILSLVTSPGSRLMLEAGRSPKNDGMTVVTMYQPDRLQIRVDVRFQDLPHVQVGQPVRIISPAIAAPLTGSVLFLSSRADIQKNTLEVKVLIDNAPSVFKPEMLVDVTFLAPAVEESQDATTEQISIYAPKRLVARDEMGSFVWTADRSAGCARQTRIETGVTSGDQVEITSGLNASSQLIVSGRAALTDGCRIAISSSEDDEQTESEKE